ncbi:MAG: 8-oxo-dGTP diphosphatase MutT [Paludibacteraceae bacterium]|nr:8-oxo-dGTP diphosphatase MutT [Paludibacteraceae bacterium]
MKHITVSAAVIHDRQGRIFATQRGYGEWKGYWEFPGGKIEPGESPEAALIREIKEELDTEIEIERHLETVEWDYPTFHITLAFFLCHIAQGELTLKEHEAGRWITADETGQLQWLPADEAFVSHLERHLSDK